MGRAQRAHGTQSALEDDSYRVEVWVLLLLGFGFCREALWVPWALWARPMAHDFLCVFMYKWVYLFKALRAFRRAG